MKKPTTPPVRIVLVDDHPMVREHLAEVIRHDPGLTVCGEAESCSQALEVIAATQPNLILIDLSLKNSHGLDLIKDIRIRHPSMLMLVLTMHEENRFAERVIRAGAHGYITKQEATKNIMEAIRCVLAGEIYLNATTAATITKKILGRRDSKLSGMETLSDREMRVFELIGKGCTMRQIAEQMFLDIKTVETYRFRIREKLQLEDANAVLQYAIHWNQLSSVDPG